MKIISLITNNWHIKLLAILVSLFLWMYAASVRTSVRNFPAEIPISGINLTPGFVAILEKDSVSVSISAEAGTWAKLSTSSFSAYVDLSGLSPGTHSVEVNVATQVSGVSIVSKNPSVMTVTIEPAVEKDVPVVAKISGDAAENMIAGNVAFTPNTVKLSGPRSIVDGISQATGEIVLSGERDSFAKDVILVALDSKGNRIRSISFLPKSVNADVSIDNASNVKNLGLRVVTKGSLAPGYAIASITTNPSSVSVYGSAEGIRTITSVPTVPIDITNLSKTITINSQLTLPVGVRTDGSLSVSVTLNITQDRATKYFEIPVLTQNLKPGLRVASVVPQLVEVQVSGPAEAIASLTQSQINISVDLAAYGKGNNRIILSGSNFSAPEGVLLISYSTQEIAVLIE